MVKHQPVWRCSRFGRSAVDILVAAQETGRVLPRTIHREVEMSNYTGTTTGATTGSTGVAKDHGDTNTTHRAEHSPARRISTETKASPKTTELFAYIAAVIG